MYVNHSFFLQFKQGLIDKYPEIFNREGNDGYTTEANFARKWGWYQSVYGIARGDINKFNQVTSLQLHECLMYLAFEKDKIDLEQKRLKSKFRK